VRAFCFGCSFVRGETARRTEASVLAAWHGVTMVPAPVRAARCNFACTQALRMLVHADMLLKMKTRFHFQILAQEHWTNPYARK